MYTYQDFLEYANNEKNKQQFILSAISQHESDVAYKTAKDAYSYYCGENPTIRNVIKYFETHSGEKIVDLISPNHKCGNGYYKYFIQQLNSYLLSNGVNFNDPETKNRLGGADFDVTLQKMGKYALNGGVCYGFFNYDRLVIFPIYSKNDGCFVALYDEETGDLRVGIRYWRISDNKPLRVTLYEEDGYTDYIFNTDDADVKILSEKRGYIQEYAVSEIGGRRLEKEENYSRLPIYPLWGNPEHISELTPILRENMDAYDMILSGLCNVIDETSGILWLLQNVAGMDEHDAVMFKDSVRRLGVAFDPNSDGGGIHPQMIDIPINAREATLDRLRSEMFSNFGAVNVQNIAAGNVTATQINSSYEPLNFKADDFETCIREFIKNILTQLGIEDSPSFTRSKIVNVSEEIAIVNQSAQHLSETYVTKKILTLLGDIDQFENVMAELTETEAARIEEDENEQL